MEGPHHLEPGGRPPLFRGLPRRLARRLRRGWRALRTGKAHPGAYAGIVVVLAAVGATIVSSIGSAHRAADRASLVAYEEAVSAPARRGGELVEREIKPSVNQFHSGDLSPALLIRFAPNWERLMREVRDDFLKVTPPGFLGDIEERWARAFDTYVKAIRLFVSSARAHGVSRERLFKRAIDTAERGDDFFDAASRVLQTWRRRFGLGPTSRFPDPEGRASEGVVSP